MKRYIRSTKYEDINIYAVLNAEGAYENIADIVGDPHKICIYDSWNQMLKDRNNQHTWYVRQNGSRTWELIKYDRWSKDLYFSYVGPSGFESLQSLYDRYPDARNYDVCLVRSFD